MSIVNGLYYGHGSDTISMVVDVLVDKWKGDAAPFTNTVRVPKASSDRIFTYNLYPVSASGSTDEEDAAMACITGVTVGDECITFICDTEKPVTSIKVSLYSQTPIIGESGQVSRDVLGSSDISKLGDGTLKSAIKYVSSAVPDVVVKQNVTIPTSSWAMDDTMGMYKTAIVDNDIKDIHIVNINIESSCLSVAINAKMSNVTESYDGGVYLYSTEKPSEDLTCDYIIMGTGSETFKNAINLVGSVDNLTTEAKTSIVDAINENVRNISNVASSTQTANDSIGSLDTLNTTNKATLVDAINENYATGEELRTDVSELQEPTFEEAATRETINSGELIGTILGKIKKLFTDIKSHAYSDPENNLTTTDTGKALDAAQGKALDDKITSINDKIGTTDISSTGSNTLTGSIDYIVTNMKDVTIVQNVTIETSAWSLNNTSGLYEATISNSNIKESNIVNVYFDDASLVIMDNAGAKNTTESFDGGVKIRTTTQPTGSIKCDYAILGK